MSSVAGVRSRSPGSLTHRRRQQTLRQRRVRCKRPARAPTLAQQTDGWVVPFTRHTDWLPGCASYTTPSPTDGSYRNAHCGDDGRHGSQLEDAVARLTDAARVARLFGRRVVGALLQPWIGHEVGQPADRTDACWSHGRLRWRGIIHVGIHGEWSGVAALPDDAAQPIGARVKGTGLTGQTTADERGAGNRDAGKLPAGATPPATSGAASPNGTGSAPAGPAAAGSAAAGANGEPRAYPPGRTRQIITAGLVLAMAVVALETTVVVTALPTIAGELDRLDLYPWVFTAYLLTSTVTVPLYGKLADIYGRRRVFLLGVVLFLVGSVLCGLAGSMTQLIVFRALQGLGAGALMPAIFTVVADLYTLKERAKVQGAFSTLWGVTSLVGPGLGAYLTIAWTWRSVFFIGVPFGLAAAVLFVCFFKERVQPRQVSLDVAGSLLLIGGLTTLLLALTQGSEGAGWASPLVLGLLLASVALLGWLIVVERRAADPVVPLAMFKMRIMSVSSAANFLSGAVLFGVTSYVPLFVQGARGEGAAGAGVALTPMLVAWSVSGFLGPRLLIRFGFRRLAIGATAMIALGAAGLALVRLDTASVWLYVSMALMGLGFGPSMAAFLMSLQEAVPWSQRGVATSSTQLFRSLGGTIGVALLGSVLHVGLMRRVDAAGLDPAAISGLLDPTGMAGAADAGLRLALGEALGPVFGLTFLCAAATLLMVLVFAREDRQPA